MTQTPFPFAETNEVDRAIIDCLRADGRASNQRIAQQVGISASAVGARIRRMEADDILRIALVADFSVENYSLLLVLGIKTSARSALAVAKDLAKLKSILGCSVAAGQHNIEAFAGLTDMEAMTGFVEDDLASIEGIQDVSISIVVDMLKYELDVVPFTAF